MTLMKQVLLIRRDLKMRRGKEIAQGSHASMDFIVSQLRNKIEQQSDLLVQLSESEIQWIQYGMAKVCLQVSSEAELLEHHQKAQAAGIQSHLIQDSGRTEFHGELTYTACAIGPDEAEKIDLLTGNLSLY